MTTRIVIQSSRNYLLYPHFVWYAFPAVAQYLPAAVKGAVQVIVRLLMLALIALSASPAFASHGGGAPQSEPELFVEYLPGEHPENLAVDSKNGDVYVTLLFPLQVDDNGLPRGEVRRYDQDGNHVATYPLPGGTVLVSGIVVNDTTGRVYVVHVSFLDFKSGVLELNPCTGEYTEYGMLPFPQGTLLNGLTPDEDGNLYVTDSALGYVWKVPSGGGNMQLWIDLQAPSAFLPPGPNGAKFGKDGMLYVAISSQSKIVRVPVNPDGSAGVPQTYIQILPEAGNPEWPFGLTPDDFAFDRANNLYLATEPMNGVRVIRTNLSIGPNLVDASDGLANTTSVAFDRRTLYVASGAFPFYQTVPVLPTPRIVKLRVAGPPGLEIEGWRDSSCNGRHCRLRCEDNSGCGQ